MVDELEDDRGGEEEASDSGHSNNGDRNRDALGLTAFYDPEANLIDALDYEQRAVPPTLEVEDAMSQEELTTGISQVSLSAAESRRQYDSLPVNTVYLSQLYHWHNTNNTRAAIRLLHSKNRLKIDRAYVIPSDDPNLAWERQEVRVLLLNVEQPALIFFFWDDRFDSTISRWSRRKPESP